METLSTGEFEGRFNDFSVRRLDLLLHRGEVFSVNHDQRSQPSDLRFLGESAGDPAVGEAGVVRTVIRENPRENVLIKTLGGGDIGCGKFDVIDAKAHGTHASRGA